MSKSKNTRLLVIFTVLLSALNLLAQDNVKVSPLNPSSWGVVYDIPATAKVKVRADVPYLNNAGGTLKMDIYSPADIKSGEKRPAIVFINAGGDTANSKVKNSEGYRTWGRLVAAHGFIGVTMETDGSRVQESLQSLFRTLMADGAKYGIDSTRIGTYAASGNISQSLQYLMGETATEGIRAAVLYYGSPSVTKIRKNLPVLFVIAESDVPAAGDSRLAALWQQVMESRAPWTLTFASSLPHAFDVLSDTEDARRVIKQTITFWKLHLDAAPGSASKPSAAREILATIFANDPQRASELLAQYTVENPHDSEGFIQQGRIFKQLQKLDDAIRAFERAAALDPAGTSVYVELGETLMAQRSWKAAADNLQKAIAGGLQNGLTYRLLAFSQLQLEQNAEAVKNYEKALAAGISPGRNTRGAAYFNLARAYVRTGQNDKAFEALEKAVSEGFNDRATFENNKDFVQLAADSRLEQILRRLTPAPK